MRCERYKNRICVEAGWLISEGYLSKSNYNNLVQRRKLLVIRRSCLGTPALVDWDTIPGDVKERITKEVGDPRRHLQRNELDEMIEWDAQEYNQIDVYEFGDHRRLKPEVKAEYAANAQVLAACVRMEKLMKGRRGTVRSAGAGTWEKIADQVERLDRSRIPHSLPINHRRLQEKAKAYARDGWTVLIHKNYQNQYAAKVADEAQRSYLLKLLSYRNNLDYEQVARVYNEACNKIGWPTITASAVAVWAQKNEHEIKSFRQGQKQFLNYMSMQVKRSAPKSPMFYWTMDGWNVELLYQKTGLNKQGQRTTTYFNRLTMVVVLDPCTMYPIGYAIGERENGELILQAFRNAINHTQELFGARYRPHQVQSDNFTSKEAKEAFIAIGERYTPSKVGNAKAKVIEPYFHYLNKNYCQFMPNWSGFGITSRKESQPNSEAINIYKKSYPDKEGCERLIDMIMQVERSSKVEAYKQAWSECDPQMKLACGKEQYLYYFGERTLPNRLTGQGLTPTVRGEKRFYESFDLEWRRHSSERWTCCYDPQDPTEVLAMNESEELRFMLEEKYVQPMALVERKEGDHEQLTKVRSFNEVLQQSLLQADMDRSKVLEDLFEENPALNHTLGKLMLTDSRNQHKEWLQIANGKEIEAKPVAVKVKAKEIESEAPKINRSEMYEGINFSDFH